MKKRRISIALAVLSFCLCFWFGGCAKDLPRFEDVVPLEYADWDGNYIYYQNARSKTTGEDFEVLVETVQVEEKTYLVKSTEDVAYYEDLIIFCFYVGETLGTENENLAKSCVVIYDVFNKTSKTIYFSEQDTLLAEVIYKVDKDYIILYNELNWFKIDWDGKIVIDYQANFSDYNTYKIYQGYHVVKINRDKIYYTTLDDGEFKEIFDYQYTGRDPSVSYREMQGRKGFLIQTVKFQKGYYESIRVMGPMAKNSYALHFYDLETGEISEFLNFSDDKHCAVQGDYFVVGEEYYIRWKTGEYEWDDVKAKNCELYHMDYVGDGKFQKTKLFSFDGEYAKMEFLDFNVTANGNLKFDAEWIQSKTITNCNGTIKAGKKRETYVLDLSTMELKEYEKNSDEAVVGSGYRKDDVVIYGIYEYGTYVEEYKTNGIYRAWRFMRYNTQTDEWATLQFWTDSEENIIKEPTEYVTEDGETLVIPPFRYCEEMWGSYYHGGFRNFIVRSY